MDDSIDPPQNQSNACDLSLSHKIPTSLAPANVLTCPPGVLWTSSYNCSVYPPGFTFSSAKQDTEFKGLKWNVSVSNNALDSTKELSILMHNPINIAAFCGCSGVKTHQ